MSCDRRYESLTHPSPEITLGQIDIVSIDYFVEENSDTSS
jgi:hypothetical protein